MFFYQKILKPGSDVADWRSLAIGSDSVTISMAQPGVYYIGICYSIEEGTLLYRGLYATLYRYMLLYRGRYATLNRKVCYFIYESMLLYR